MAQNKKYIIHLAGGLANIIFQMNLAHFLKKNGNKVILDTSWLIKNNSSVLQIVYKLFDYGIFDKKKTKITRIFFMFLGKLRSKGNDKMYSLFNYNYLLGYWHYDFFFNIKLLKSNNFDSSSSSSYGCIHYRLGDYRASKSHDIKSPQFFLEKLFLVKNSYENIFLCTDEPNCKEIKHLLTKANNLILYEADTYNTFLKLMNSNFIIGSNSTFSYCAHIYGQNKGYFDSNYIESFKNTPPKWIIK